MTPLVIGIAGSIRSGKTTVSQHMRRRYGAHVFRNSAILGDILNRLHIEPSRRNYAKLGEALFASFGYAVLAETHRREIERSASENMLAVIDGIRFPEEIEAYSHDRDFRLIFLRCRENTRFERATKSADGDKLDDRRLSLHEFAAIEETTSESRLPELAMQAHAIIENEESVQALLARVDQLCRTWGIVPPSVEEDLLPL